MSDYTKYYTTNGQDRILHSITTETPENVNEQHTQISQEGISRLTYKIQNQNTCGFSD